MKDMLVITVATSLSEDCKSITRELPGGYSKSQGTQEPIILNDHFTFCLLVCPDARLNMF